MAARSAAPAITPNPVETRPVTTNEAEDGVVGLEVQIAPLELGGREGPEPTRFGDWEKNGRCIDF